MKNTRLRLKHKHEDDLYANDTCAVSKCMKAADIIDGSRSRWPFDVPLCYDHYEYMIKPDEEFTA